MIIEKTDETNFEIKDCGKLASSSYFDKPTRVLCPDTKTLLVATSIDESTNNNLVNPNQQEPQNQSNITNDTNLYVRSCIFSPNDTYLAWICGYKIVKIMKYKESKTLMRSFSMDPTQTNSTNTNSNTLKVNDIAEIECAELVKSLAFGSSKSFVSNRHNLHLRTSKLTNTRFNIGENNLLLAVGLISGKIRIYDATSLTFLLGLFDHTDMVNDLKFTVDGSLQLASASSDETIKLWNIYEDGNMYKTIKGHHAGKINCCDWSPTAKLLCSVGINRQAYIWDTESFKLKHTLRGHLHNVSSCKFSPDGALLATGSYDTKILIWNPYSGVAIKQFCHMLPPPRLIYAGGDNGAFVRALAFSKEGDHLVSICDDKKIRIWSLCNRSSYPLAECESKDSYSCAYSSTTRTIMVGTKNGQINKFKVPIVIPKLVDICRKVVNQILNQPVYELNLPKELKKFLVYDDIRDEAIASSGSPQQINHSPTVAANTTINTSRGSNFIIQGTTVCN